MSTNHAPYDLVGIGFGPAGIALAAALDDAEEALGAGAPRLRRAFLEQAPSSEWQPGMLLPGTDIQHHFLRDFASPRDPRSRFTFANYLKQTGRLFPFCLLGGGWVGRLEWSDYVEWAARQVSQPVLYNHEAVAVAPLERGGRVAELCVTARDLRSGARSELVARNLVLQTGQVPLVPEELRPALGKRVFHAASYLPMIQQFDPADRPSFAVVGAGQNAGEILAHLAQAFPRSQIHSVARNSGFRMYNLGQFSNEVYFPEETDYFYGLGRDRRRAVFEEVHSTNYACVDPDLSTALYRMFYEDRFAREPRLHMRKRTAVLAISEHGGACTLSLEEVHTGERDDLEADVVVLCTGFQEPRLPHLLEPLRDLVRFDPDGDPEVSRAYRLGLREDVSAGIWLNGLTEWRHGISNATSFSMMALKAEEIREDVARCLRTRDRSQAVPAP